ncbi:MAG: Xaa-Pro aminopeptidase [Actinomycetia bacterium]|nr:Xaa-Pro aminopeptidase [Actinomycetes bacterium]
MSRLAACLSLMAHGDVDVLFLGREANARTVSDAGRLWLAGTRAFSPGCVVVRHPAAVHVLSNTDAVLPHGFPVEHLYGVTWNPERLVNALAAIEGVSEAHRVGVDGMSPMASALVARVAPSAEIIDAGPMFAELWGIPDREKVAGVERASVVARDGLDAMVGALRPGVRPRDLRGVCAAQFAFLGATTPAFDAVAAPFGDSSSTWLPPERELVADEQVVLRAGVLREGWEASLARTYVVGSPSVAQPPPAGWDDLVADCTPGATAGALRARGAVVHGAGRGVEPWPDDLELVADLMLALELRDATSLRQDILRITNGPAQVVTT